MPIVSAFLAAFPVVSVVLQPAGAQQLVVGDAPPPITLASWLNCSGDTKPTLAALAGKVVMLEFWGTWCGPCVRAMPEVQKLHDRYGDRGLVVLAISYESAAVLRPFLERNSYTMTVGSDPDKHVVAAYGIKGWPTTYVIGKDGNIAHIGSPYGAEAAVERALGLETSPATLLTAWFDAKPRGDADRRAAMVRLLERAPPDFDLRAWALANGGAEQAVAAPGSGVDAGTPVEAAAAKPTEDDGVALLRKTAALWGDRDVDKLHELLRQLGATGPTAFDLAVFVREAFGKEFPLDAKELRGLLKEQKFADALQAIVDRNPATSVIGIAAKDRKLRDYCRNKAAETRELAKKGIMVQRWVFAGALPKDNDAFWKELAVSGMATSEDKKQITGVLIGGANVERAKIEGFVQGTMALAIAMDALAAGKPQALDGLGKAVAAERRKVVAQLEARYGAPAVK